MKKVCISGYFDPLHVGHLEYINKAKELGDYLVVIVNNNFQCKLKKGKFFMDEKDRVAIVKNLKSVDEVFLSIDKDKTVSKSLEKLKPSVFANGGDRNKSNIPEMSVEGIDFAFNVGGEDKMNSSSLILKKWRNNTEERLWGEFSNLFVEKHVKVNVFCVVCVFFAFCGRPSISQLPRSSKQPASQPDKKQKKQKKHLYICKYLNHYNYYNTI